jgi:TIR domain-containing protein
MPFSDIEREFFDNLYWEKSQPIRDKYDAALKELDYVNDINKHPFYLNEIREFAREDIGALVRAYIEVYERVGKSPDEADFEAFVDELKGLIPRFQEYFASRFRGPFSQLPAELVDRILETLSLQIGEIIGLALTPLRLFMSERKIAASLIKPSLKVFISYKWEDDTHNIWVESFAGDLRAAGIDAKLDKWEVRLGDSFTDYMTSKIAEADVVLFIMTSLSVAAAEAPTGEGGAVKFEMQMATSRRIAGERMRLIGVYREGNKTAAHLRDHRYADFRDDSHYESSLHELIDDLLEKEKRPPLGATFDRKDAPRTVGLSPEAQQLLTQATLDPQGIILMVATFGGLTMKTNAHSFAEPGNARSEAKWRSIIQELLGRGFIEQRDQKGQVFGVTNTGYEVDGSK